VSHQGGTPGVAQRGEILHQDLLAAQEGDALALERFATAAREELSRAVEARLRGGWTRSWVEDVVQDAMVNVCAHYHDCRAATVADLLGWLRSIGRRQVANLFRAEARWRDATTTLGPTPLVGDEKPGLLSPWASLLRQRLALLGTDPHKLLWLRFEVNASWAEVARELQTTPSGAKRRYQRLVARLRRWRPCQWHPAVGKVRNAEATLERRDRFVHAR